MTLNEFYFSIHIPPPVDQETEDKLFNLSREFGIEVEDFINNLLVDPKYVEIFEDGFLRFE